MASITLKGNAIETIGNLPAVGTKAPEFTLVGLDLGNVQTADFVGKKVVLNIFPSIDTGTCATSVRKFNQEASSLDNTVVLCISADLPFAMKRFCGAEGIENVQMGSAFRSPEFGQDFGVTFTSGPLTGLLSRSIVVLSEDGTIKHTEQVMETADEPNYEAALKALK